MAVKWYVVAKYRNGETVGLHYATDSGIQIAISEFIRTGATLLKFELQEPEKTPDYPPVPTPLEVEHERWLIDAEREQDNFDSMQMEKKFGA
jgi:hypothetical protein